MEEISIMLHYGGMWVARNKYDTNFVEGLVVRSDTSLKLLREEIATQIGIDPSRNKMRLRYIVDSSPAPMEIRNDMGVKLYMMLKRKVPDLSRYPLCVDNDRNEMDIDNMGRSFNLTTGTVEYHESQNDCRALVEADNAMAIDNIIADPKHKLVEVAQVYSDKNTLVAVMHNYALENKFQFYAKRSDPKSYELICKLDNCKWSFRASVIHGSKLFIVRIFNNVHTCPFFERRFDQRQATSKVIAAMSIPQLMNHKRKITPNDICADVFKTMGVDITYNKAWRAKELGMKILMGGPSEGYLRLPVYLHVLAENYPGSYIKYHTDENNRFMYLFIALGVSIEGFKHCRPIVVVDGCHLTGPYLGTFLSASTLDGSGHILPLAYGVVDFESDASWSWFFTNFRAAFGVHPNMAIVSDRAESIWKAVSVIFPNAVHLACMWHVWKNVCKKYKRSADSLSAIFYKMAKSYTRDEFDVLMAGVNRIDSRVRDYLHDVGYEKWSRAYAPINRGRMTTSNIAETINSCLFEARKLHLLEFLEKCRELFAKWNCVNGNKARYMSDSRLGDTYQELLEKYKAESTILPVQKSSEYIYSVDHEGKRYIVCLKTNTCTCEKFQYNGLPCEHAIAVFRKNHITDLMPYCSDYYKKSMLMKIYADSFAPMPLKAQWVAPDDVVAQLVLPPQ